MNVDDLYMWAKGYILICIGAGKYDDAVYDIVARAYGEGFKAGERGKVITLIIEDSVFAPNKVRYFTSTPTNAPNDTKLFLFQYYHQAIKLAKMIKDCEVWMCTAEDAKPLMPVLKTADINTFWKNKKRHIKISHIPRENSEGVLASSKIFLKRRLYSA